MSDAIDPFEQPCDLWVLPPPRSSAWFAKVDWYLNWQLSKGLAYSGLHLPNEILRLSEEYEVELPAYKRTDASAPLLVISHGRLQARKCVVIDDQASLENWLKAAHDIALNLDAKTVHIFLPGKLTKDQAAKVWSAKFMTSQVRFSADTEARTP